MPITIHGVPRSRELIIQNKSIVNRLLVDFQYPITEGLFEFFFFFFFFLSCCIGILTYHKCSFNFPLLLIQNHAGKPVFFSLSCDEPHSFRAFYIVGRY